MRKALLAAGVAATGVVLVVGGCGTPSGPVHVTNGSSAAGDPAGTGGPASDAAGAADSGEAGAGTSAGDGGGTKPAKAAAVTRCHTNELGARLVEGTPYSRDDVHYEDMRLVFTNKSGSTCTIYGFPGADWVGGSEPSKRFSLPRDGSPSRITLGAGKSAHAVLHVYLPSNSESPWLPATLEVTPPDETTHFTLRWPSAVPVNPNAGKESDLGLANAIFAVTAGA